jgi:hypothetical protein
MVKLLTDIVGPSALKRYEGQGIFDALLNGPFSNQRLTLWEACIGIGD